MGHIILVTGGARSGKSSFAESLYKHSKDVVYIATARICDDEMRERVQMHRQSRPQEWTTVEATKELYKAVTNQKNYLLDCLTVMASNRMFDMTKDDKIIPAAVQKQVEESIVEEIGLLIDRVRKVEGNLVMVTNEIGYSIVPETHIGRVYRDIIGRVNQRAAAQSDEVYFVVCGIPQKIK